MTADNGADGAQENLFGRAAERLHQRILNQQRILFAVAMADEDDLIFVGFQFAKFHGNRAKRLHAAAHLASGNQSSLAVHMQHRLDAERAARSKARAEALLAQKNLDKRDMQLAEARLRRALVRSSVAARKDI